MKQIGKISLLIGVALCLLGIGCSKIDPSPFKSRIRVWTDLDTNVYGLSFRMKILLDGDSIGLLYTNYENPCDNCDHLDGEYYSKSAVFNKCLVRNISIGQHTITGIMKGYLIDPYVFTVKEGECLPINIPIRQKSDSAVGKVTFWGLTSNTITNNLNITLNYDYKSSKNLVTSNSPVTVCGDTNLTTFQLFEGTYHYSVIDKSCYSNYNCPYNQSGSVTITGKSCSLVELK
jgi:hypothetical protein